jgi:hypothetical protein
MRGDRDEVLLRIERDRLQMAVMQTIAVVVVRKV